MSQIHDEMEEMNEIDRMTQEEWHNSKQHYPQLITHVLSINVVIAQYFVDMF